MIRRDEAGKFEFAGVPVLNHTYLYEGEDFVFKGEEGDRRGKFRYYRRNRMGFVTIAMPIVGE